MKVNFVTCWQCIPVIGGLSAMLMISQAIATNSTLVFESCRIDDLPSAVQCAMVEAPLAPSDNRSIRVQVVRLPALTRNPMPDPVVLLAGGPGQAASQLGRLTLALNALRRERDVLLIDQRGTGRSQSLDCKLPSEDDPLPDLLAGRLLPEGAKHCFDTLRDVAGYYATHDYIRDLELVRQRLGIRQFNLWGGSYGTRVVQEYLRLHPERVRTAVMDGVVPPDVRLTIDIAGNNEARMASIVADCQRSPTCRAAYPRLQQTMANLPQRLNQSPLPVDQPHPWRATRLMGRFGHAGLAASLGAMLYQPETQAWVPRLLHLAGQGEVAPLLAAYSQLSQQMGEQVNSLLYFAVACVEDGVVDGVPPNRLHLFSPMQSMAREVCQAWRLPAKPLSGMVKSNVPTLLLSGGLDPVTPPAYANRVAQGLVNRYQLLAPQLGHVISPNRCIPRVIHEFIRDAKAGQVAKECELQLKTMPPLPFFVSDKEARP
ncbi:alpha/beta fold hydrolase [Chitinivorax sp. B]|uniref:alpha/beta fold hydrolase n=1 Tax=Chitinivorax sp. B TaxID=2502235 RepID=UPI0010F8EA6A|nr:alpha/beta fold hydrolase [Chitinivorax sp. B]